VNATVKKLFGFSGSLAFLFVWMIILESVLERWPSASAKGLGCFLAGFTAWYLWKFVIQPFREGLNGQPPA